MQGAVLSSSIPRKRRLVLVCNAMVAASHLDREVLSFGNILSQLVPQYWVVLAKLKPRDDTSPICLVL